MSLLSYTWPRRRCAGGGELYAGFVGRGSWGGSSRGHYYNVMLYMATRNTASVCLLELSDVM